MGIRDVLAKIKGSGAGGASPSQQSPGRRTSPVASDVTTMPLDRFARAGPILEVASSLLAEHVWFVSGAAEVQILVERGIPRGKIYTAQELLVLLNLPGMDGDKVKRIHEAKELFDGTVQGREEP